MKARIIRRVLTAQLLLFSIAFSRLAVEAVPMAPNESWVVAAVVAIAVVDSSTLDIQPQQKLFRYQLRITNVEAVPGADNVLRGYEGRTIEALTREPLGSDAVKGQKVKVRISFQGDERRGHYWILESALIPRAQ
ncbi:MAG: hypothetical protein FJ145_12715 [Deltaproteobacteria bacterium]|nr:hypothetical protein [Deltaproteobacteria bacterium]